MQNRVTYLATAIALFAPTSILWNVVFIRKCLQASKSTLSVRSLLLYFLKCQVLGFLPANCGAEVMRAWVAKRYLDLDSVVEINQSASTSWEKLIYAILFATVVTGIFKITFLPLNLSLFTALSMIVLVINRFKAAYFREKHLVSAVTQVASSLLFAFLIFALSYGLEFCSFCLLLKSVDTAIFNQKVLITFSVIHLMGRFPFTPAGLGIVETFGALFLDQLIPTLEHKAALVSMWATTRLIAPLLVGLVAWTLLPKQAKHLSSQAPKIL